MSNKNQGKGKKGGKPTQNPDTSNGGAPLGKTSGNTGTSLGAAGTSLEGTALGAAGTSLGGTSLGGTSLGGTSLGGTSLGAAGTSLGGTSLGGTSLGGTSLGAAGTSLGGTSLGGTSLGGTSLGTSLGGTSLGAAGTSLGGTSLGGTSLGAAGTSLGGTSLGAAGTSLGGTSLGTSLGAAGTSLGGKSLGGTSLGAAGTSLGGTSLGGTSLGGTSLGAAGTSLGGTSLGGTSLGAAGTSLGGTSLGTLLGAAGTSLGTSLGAAGTSLGGTALGAEASLGGTSLGTSLGGTSLGSSGGASLGNSTGTSLGSATSIGGTGLGGTALGEIALGETDDADEPEVSEEKSNPGKKGNAKTSKATAPAKNASKKPEPVKPTGNKAAAAHVARVKALQAEQEKRKREEEERKRLEEEAEKKRIEEEKRAEEERLKLLEIRKAQREEAKKKQAEIDAQRKREEAMKKYGIDPSLVVGLGRGRGGRGRGRGGRRGRGRGKDESGEHLDKKEDADAEGEAEENAEEPSNTQLSESSSITESSSSLTEITSTSTTNTTPSSIEATSTSTEATETTSTATTDSKSASNGTTADTPAVAEPADSWETEDWESKVEVVTAEVPKQPSEPKKEDQHKEELRKQELQKKEDELRRKEQERKHREEEKRRKEEEDHRRREEAEEKKAGLLVRQNAQKLRSPIVCVLGHVDTGKTLLLDKIRSSNIQAGEAGGITQQIGATFFPNEVIRDKTKELTEHLKNKLAFKLPGLLIIDTPGHESFSNLRSRGSSLCDIAILVIDLMHGLEPQTKESIRLLKSRNTPFVVALNKVDRIFGWKSTPSAPFQISLTKQDQSTRQLFEERVRITIADLASESLNAVPYYQNKDFKKTVSLVPTSAVTGEGIPDLLMLLVQLTQNLMSDKLLELSELDCTVLEVKKLPGRGTTLDVILANGVLKQGEKIVVCGMNGEPIVTNIRSILTPPLLGEMRAKNTSDLVPNKEVRAAIGCKIDAPGLDEAVAGSQLFVVKPGEDVEKYKAEVMKALISLEGKVDKSGFGVYVQSSTLGSMEALLEFLKEVCKIPVSGIRIGPVHKKDVIRASVMLEHKPEFACILAFDVKVMPDAREYSENVGVRIFEADVIYHLQEQFQKYLEEVETQKKNNLADKIVFPCILSILPEHVYRARDPIVLGVKVEEGIVKIGTPIVVPSQGKIEIGIIRGIRKADKSEIVEANAGDEVSVEIAADITKQKYSYDRHFTDKDKLVSLISRNSIDALKEAHPDLCKTREIFKLIQSIKHLLGVL